MNCKEWNTSGHSAPLTDFNAYQDHPDGVWLNRVHTYEAGEGPDSRTVHFPRSCLHCEQPACVTVCPTGASYKRAEDGIVLVNADICIGCKLCSWACPYGAREFDEDQGVMRKCTLCIDRIYNENMPEQERVPACVAACPAQGAAFRRSRRSGQRGVATRRGARRLRSDAGDGLQAGEQIPAAAAASDAARHREETPRAADRRCCAGSTGCCRDEPGVLRHLPDHRIGCRLRHAGLARRAERVRALPPVRWFGVVAALLALALCAAGLLASTFHLGHPERAWRAVSQWRSSWLSREGVLGAVHQPARAWRSPQHGGSAGPTDGARPAGGAVRRWRPWRRRR